MRARATPLLLRLLAPLWATLILAWPVPARSQPRRSPPPEAYSACEGLRVEEACSFKTPRGSLSGLCYYLHGRLGCVPHGRPIPPDGRGERLEAADPGEVAPEATVTPLSMPTQAAVPLPAPPPPAAPAPAAPVPAAPVPAALPAAAPAPASAPAPGASLALLLGVLGAAAGLLSLWRSRPDAAAPATAAVPSAPAEELAGAAETAATFPVTRPAPSADATVRATAPSGGFLIVEGYEAIREIGSGGMGVVYEALDLKLDRRVALKKMRPEVGRSARGKERFLTEARTVAKLQHPNIVGIHAVVEKGEDLYLVFELVEGLTLEEMLDRRARIPPAEALALLRGVADAMDYAHGRKVIHRDLKPSNIIVDAATGRAKVMDFGIAHLAKLTVSKLTVAESYGTMAYMPPEQALGQTVRESDVFSFAAVAYEALTGGVPFPGPDFHLQKVQLAFARPSLGEPPLPAPLDAVFERALQPEPKKRHATTGDLIRELEKALPS